MESNISRSIIPSLLTSTLDTTEEQGWGGQEANEVPRAQMCVGLLTRE